MIEDNELWSYAVKVYSDRETAELCLTLQNVHQLSVNRLLFALWLAEQRRTLPAGLDDTEAKKWRLELLEPLRMLRYQLRKSKQSMDEDRCYQQLKIAELSAEKVEIGLLFALKRYCPSAVQLAGLGYRNLCSIAEVEPEVSGELQTLLGHLSDKASSNGSI
ncbi:TIGR02444 family protein [Amphritea japonica]|uniref:TIGR02444 family protein n=1 Tax=Amphritea japonica ATCC BAA-1530 TaxID=1278309 RepID=A0A7R6PEY5_9GAMM|nr:TIGR02444 family protein [Amphritea japonica]BBB27876.1 conserved hypothetical protein [Amphritea japonica ATCC BAA-1530]